MDKKLLLHFSNIRATARYAPQNQIYGGGCPNGSKPTPQITNDTGAGTVANPIASCEIRAMSKSDKLQFIDISRRNGKKQWMTRGNLQQK